MTTSPEQETGKALQVLRLRADARLADVAVTAGTSVGYLSRVENGQVRASPLYIARVTRAIADLMRHDVEADAA